MVDAVLLILREVLEAALILSLLLALSRKYELNTRWCWFALAGGFLGSWLLAHFAYNITEAMEAIGQEVLNVVLYLIVVVCLILLSLLLIPLAYALKLTRRLETIAAFKRQQPLIWPLFIVIVSFSLAREGSEIWIYLSDFSRKPDEILSVLIGVAIGAGIGMSLGAITYYFLLFMSDKIFMPLFITVITLLSGGLSMQIAKQLMQAGLLTSSDPLWDSSMLISEQSWLGELLYALLGYDAQPTPVQGVFYLLTTIPIVASAGWHWWSLKANARK